MGIFDLFNKTKIAYSFENAILPKTEVYEGEFGIIKLTEGELTALPKNPHSLFKKDDFICNFPKWVIAFYDSVNNEYLGYIGGYSFSYNDALEKKLKKFIINEDENNFYIVGLSKEELELNKIVFDVLSSQKLKKRVEKYNSEINSVELYDIKVGDSVPRNNLFMMNNLRFQNITKSFNKNMLNKFVAISISTTGLDAIKDNIVEICAVRYFNFKPIDKFCTYIKPNNEMTIEQEKISGLTNKVVSNASSVNRIMKDFDNYINDFPIVCYNSNFVLKFLFVNGSNVVNNKKIKIYDVFSIYKKIFDSADLSYAFQHLMKFDFKNTTESRCFATAKVFEECIYLITDDDAFYDR